MTANGDRIIYASSANDIDRLYIGAVVEVYGQLGIVTGLFNRIVHILQYDGSMISIDKAHKQNIKQTTLYIPAICNILNDMKKLNYIW